MRALGVTTFGGPERLHGELRIVVAAAAVNPTDAGLREGKGVPADLAPPYVPGMDAAGVVDAIGDGVELSVGDRVVAVVDPRRPQGGAYAEKVVVPAESVARVPDGMDLVEAATLPLNGLTAVRALELLDLPFAGTVAITGAAGAVGGYAIQLAVHRGFRVVADAKDEDRELVSGFGAHRLVPRGPGFGEAVRRSEPGGVDGVLDAAVLGADVLPGVRDGGVVAAVRAFDGEPEREIRVYLVTPPDYLHRGKDLTELVHLAERGVLTLRVAETLPWDQAAEAHRRLAAGGVRGRIVLTP
jgi:NADPH2:quinone reductase